MSMYKILDKVDYPIDLKHLSINELKLLANEVRSKTIETVSQTGGHLGAGLGVVELTVALHYVFDTPNDAIIWDIGHQTYPHKILTGRKKDILSLRQEEGLSGFPKISESIYDCFGVGHSSTSISAALGMAVARDYDKRNQNIIAVIGDGAMSAGLAYEAMNNAGALKSNMIVILNDNKMSISPAVGALNNYLTALISSKPYFKIRKSSKLIINRLPSIIKKVIKKAESNIKFFFNDSNFFENMGFYYIGPVDGHNINNLVSILSNIKNNKEINRPFLLHIKTEKGKGFDSPIKSEEKYHSIAKFNPETKLEQKKTDITKTYTNIFSEKLIKLALKDDKIVAITAAMPSGTGLDKFLEKFPDRTFDVGIAEQHAVTFAAGLATCKYKPYVAIYSTFLQRAYDQIIHDVAIQNLPVRFMIDRAGYVGADGATHAGSFDIAYLSIIPNMIIMVPSDESELIKMLNTSVDINNAPSVIRYPRGNITGLHKDFENDNEKVIIGKGRVLKAGKSGIAILNLGTRLNHIIEANHKLLLENIDITIADARFAKPIDVSLVSGLAKNHELIIIIEEGCKGGFSSQVLEILAQDDLLKSLTIKTLNYPDIFYNHATQESQNTKAGLDKENIYNIIRNYHLNRKKIKVN